MTKVSALAARELTAAEYLPYVQHVEPWAVLQDDGSIVAVEHISGRYADTSDPDEINGWHEHLNQVFKSIADDRLVLTSYVIRSAGSPEDYPNGAFLSKFSRELDDAYRSPLMDGRLYRNDLFLAVHLRLPTVVGDRLSGWLTRKRRPPAEARSETVRKLLDVLMMIEADLAPYRPRRLGLRREGRVLYSEIGEMFASVLSGRRRKVPLLNGRLGSAIYTDRIIAEHDTVRIWHPDGTTYVASFGMREYPATTWPGHFDRLLSAPYYFVLTQTFGFLSKQAAEGVLSRKQNMMVAAGDKAHSQRDELTEAADHLLSNRFVMGSHHLSLTVFAPSRAALADVAAQAASDLSDSGAVAVREDLGLEGSIWAQLVGNMRLRARPGAVSSRNFAGMAAMHNYPRGPAEGFWGPPLALLRARGGTPYRFHLHVEGVGNVFMTGPVGSGKTVLLGFMLSQAEKLGVQSIVFDKDRGLEIAVRAMGGSYLVLPSGEPSGCAPLKAMDPTPENLTFLSSLVRGLIVADGEYEITPDDDRRINLGITALMQLPPAARSLGELRAFLGVTDPKGAGARLEKWCSGGELGWALDGEDDLVRLDAPVLGFDMTAVLDNPQVRGPLMAYLFYRTEQLIDGRRVITWIDEFWKALLDPAFRDIVHDALKTRRKRNSPVILATQSPRDALNSPIAHSIIEQCPTQIHMPNARADREDYVDGLKLTGPEFRMIREDMLSGGRSFLVKQGATSVVCDLDLSSSPDHVAFLSGRSATVRLLERLMKQHGPDPDDWMPAFKRQWREAAA